MKNSYGLEDRVAVVTGAGSGIGRGVARAFAEEGARVAIIDLDRAGAEETLSLIEAGGGAGLAIECDTTDPAAVTAAQAKITQSFGEVDALVNNAGIVRSGLLEDLSLDDWNRVLSVNLTGYFICSQAFGRPMLARGRGAVVHVASITAIETMAKIGSYGVAKAGVTMLSQLLAAEWSGRGVRSNAVHPGLVRTPLTQASYDVPGIARGRAEAVPMGRVAQPEDIAEAVLYLASPRAGYVSGASLLVDGGLAQNLMTLIPRYE